MNKTTQRGELHEPVLRDRVVELFQPALTRSGGLPGSPVFVDATLGMGGHAAAILAAYPTTILIGIDRDPMAIQRSKHRLAAYRDRCYFLNAVYDQIPAILDELALDRVEAVLFDLGVSSPQLDEADRGFAYAQDAPLDMRMDPTHGVTAAEIVNTYPEAELSHVIADYGEERFARRIAAAIVAERAKQPLTSSARLAELVREAIPAPARRTGGHPAKRTFQALRIEVNQELTSLARALPAAITALRVGGRIAVLSYHSLEDRIVKGLFVAEARNTTPADLPVELPDQAPFLRLLTRGAEQPTAAEIDQNPRATSARLRAAERVREAPS